MIASVLGVVLVGHQMVISQEPAPAAPADVAEKPADLQEKPIEEGADAESVLPPVAPLAPGEVAEVPPVPAAAAVAPAGKVTKDSVVTFASDAADAPEVPLAGITLYRDARMKTSQGVSLPPASGPGVLLLEGLSTPKPDELRKKLDPFLGKKATYRDLEKIVAVALEHYRVNNRPMTHVYIPKQPYSNIMRFAVIEGRVGEVIVLSESDVRGKSPASMPTYEKNFQNKLGKESWWDSWYRDPYQSADLKAALAPRIDQIRGRVVDIEELNAQMTAINRSPWARLNRPVEHPFRDVDVVFSPPESKGNDLILGQTDLVFEVRDQRPLRFYMGYENNLTYLLGEDRFFAGATWYDAFRLGLDHQLGVQFFTASDPNELWGLAASYLIPWKNAGQFTALYASYADSTVDTLISGTSSEIGGDNTLFGGRHYFELPGLFGATSDSMPLGTERRAKEWADPKREAIGLHHEVGAGFDFKATTNDVFFGGTAAADSPADIVQFVIEYNARQTDPLGETNLSLQVFMSPGGITSDNSDEAFEQLRLDSSATYIYTRARLEREQDLPYRLMGRAALTGQVSNGNLLASEQLGVGGFDSVRGYVERIHRGDLGYVFNLELYSPQFMPSRDWCKLSHDDSLRFLTFFDVGYGEASNDEPSDPTDDGSTLMSVGLGLRYEFENDLAIRCDYGFQLKEPLSSAEDRGDGYFNLGAVWSF